MSRRMQIRWNSGAADRVYYDSSGSGGVQSAAGTPHAGGRQGQCRVDVAG